MRKSTLWLRVMQLLGGLITVSGTFAGFKYGQGKIMWGIFGTVVVMILGAISNEAWKKVLHYEFIESNEPHKGDEGAVAG